MSGNDAMKGAEHVMTHGTAKTRAARAGSEEKSGKDGSDKGGKKAKGKKKLRRMEVEPAQNGGYVVKHVHQPPEAMTGSANEDETYALGNTQALHDHIDEHLGGGDSAGEEEQSAAAGAGAGAAGGEQQA